MYEPALPGETCLQTQGICECSGQDIPEPQEEGVGNTCYCGNLCQIQSMAQPRAETWGIPFFLSLHFTANEGITFMMIQIFLNHFFGIAIIKHHLISPQTIDPFWSLPIPFQCCPTLLLASQVRVQKTIWKRGNLDEISTMLKTNKVMGKYRPIHKFP